MDINKRRILSFAVQARWFGFAVLDHQCKLVDWGMTFFQQNSTAKINTAKRRVKSLMFIFDPTLIAVSVSNVAASHNAPSARLLATTIRAEARVRSIPLQSIHRQFIRDAFKDFNARSKDEIASAIVKLFPELRWKLPSKRRTWEKEHFRLALFDAVAISVACWKHLSETNSCEDGMAVPSGRPLGDV